MALPAGDLEGGHAGSPERKGRAGKKIAVAVGAAFAVAACVALAMAPSRGNRVSELVAISPAAHRSLDELAMNMLKHAATMPESQMLDMLRAWRDQPGTVLSTLLPKPDGPNARTEMLVGTLRSRVQMLGASDSKLCAKKDIIIQKFDDLLKKLGAEELALNISLGKMSAEWKAAMEGWLDSESTYRLRIEQAKEARQGAKFAEQEYEKYREAQKEAKNNYEVGLEKHNKEREELDGERELIKMIMRYIGVLHDIKPTEKSIAAGGKESTVDPETGVSDPYTQEYKAGKTQELSSLSDADNAKLEKTKAELEQKIKLLSQLAQKTGLPGTSTKLAVLMPKSQKLAVYKESVEVAKILKEMLDDIETRRMVIDKVDAEAKKLLDEVTAKIVEWEGKLAALGDAKDKAKSLMDAAKLEREKLNGEQKVMGTAEKEAEDAAKVMIPPYEREIYVIVMIKKKILDHCSTGGREDTPQDTA
jgi:hypothetical protein